MTDDEQRVLLAAFRALKATSGQNLTWCPTGSATRWPGSAQKRRGFSAGMRKYRSFADGSANGSDRPRSCENMISDAVVCATAVARAGRRARSGRDRLHQRVDAEDIDHSLHIVGQHL